MTARKLDLTDVYTGAYVAEVEHLRALVDHYSRRIFREQLLATGIVASRTRAELFERAGYPSAVAHLFTQKLVEYLLDKGHLQVGGDDKLSPTVSFGEEPEPGPDLLAFFQSDPHRKTVLEMVTRLHAAIPQILAGKDGIMAMAHQHGYDATLNLWEEVQVHPVKMPCHALVARALLERLRAGPCTVLEGGAGVGAVLRHALLDEEIWDHLEALQRYYFTEINPQILRRGRARIATIAPPWLMERIEFSILNLDHIDRHDGPFARDESVDVVILEHVLYDLRDLRASLRSFRRILRPGGFLVFTMSFRQRPAIFFPCEFLQSTLNSYVQAKLEPGLREHHGYLTVEEWDRSLRDAGFDDYEVYPAVERHEACPFGGIVAHKAR